MVRILLDPSMYHPHLSVADELRKAAELGVEHLELSPRADFHEWHHHPKVDRHQIAEVRAAMEETGVLHIADVFDHTANVGNRYIMNPPGVDARIHQHNEIGNGEIDWDAAFAHLREREYDGPVSVCVFGWEEEADAINVRMRERIQKELGGG